MRVFLLVPSYLDLYKPIVQELNRQGYEIEMIFDQVLRFDYHFASFPFFEKIKMYMNQALRNIEKKFWKKTFENYPQFDSFFDILMVINGCCYSPQLLSLLRKRNPNIKSVLYVWDTRKYYNYFKYKENFDAVFSFDLSDCEKYHVKYYPFFWVPSLLSKNEESKYDIFFVGSNHDDRLNIINRIIPQLQKNGLSYNISIYTDENLNDPYGLICRKPMSIELVNHFMMNSRCILDTDRETQMGITPRLIWALAMGKKVITTNVNIMRLGHFNTQQIAIIDRNNPIIDTQFINKPYLRETSSFFNDLRIDRWIQTLLK